MTKVTRLTLDDEGGLDRRRIHLREISGDLDAPLDTVGQDLRAARMRRGDDLATVSRALKIRKDHLEALEEDRIEALPGRTYAVGFIRSYADYLGLDAVQCVERFKAEIAGRSDTSTPPITVIDEDAERRMPHGWKIMAAVVVVLVLYGAYQLAASADRALNEPAVTPAPQLVHRPVAHKIKPPEQLTVTQPLTHPLDTSLPLGDGVANPANPPGTPAANAPGNTATPPPAQAAAAAPNPNGLQSSGIALTPPPLPQGQVYGDTSKAVRVVLRARSATRILVQAPGGRIMQNRLLKPGDTYRVPNMTGLTLTTSNAGGVQIEVDGTVAGLMGRPDESIDGVSLDPQSIMDHNGGNHGR